VRVPRLARAAPQAEVVAKHGLRARAGFADAVRLGRAAFREGTVERIPFDDGAFTKVCTINTVYFWSSLDAGVAEIRRVLASGGRAVIGFLPRERTDVMGLPADIFTTRAPEEIVRSLSAVGFTDVRLERPRPTTPWTVAVATK
jgi:arsenite methyltransferase